MSNASRSARGPLRALVFDKDGTLFDFQKSWGPFGLRVVEQLAASEPERMRGLAEAIGLDLGRLRYDPNSPVIHGAATDIVAALAPWLPDWRADHLLEWLAREAQSVGPMAPASDDLAGLLDALKSEGFALGVATNDGAEAARRQLETAGVADRFDFIAGYDSVPTPKPAPDMILAFAAAVDAPLSEVAMVGDSPFDIAAARSAGCGAAIAVLTGPTPASTLAPLADAVLPSIEALPRWLFGDAAEEPSA